MTPSQSVMKMLSAVCSIAFDNRRRLASWRMRSDTSVRIARNRSGAPDVPFSGTMLVSTQNVEPFFARLQMVPRQVCPPRIVVQRSSKNSRGWWPELQIRWFAPISSWREYPLVWQKLSFTYRIVPSGSVRLTSIACSRT
jgi:hypothetical protein